MKTVKSKRWINDGKEDYKLMGTITGGMSLDEKSEIAWLIFGTEFPGFKEDQSKQAFDRSMKRVKCK